MSELAANNSRTADLERPIIDATLITELKSLFSESKTELHGHPSLGKAYSPFRAHLDGENLIVNVHQYGMAWAVVGTDSYVINGEGVLCGQTGSCLEAYNPYMDGRVSLQTRCVSNDDPPTANHALIATDAIKNIIEQAKHDKLLASRQSKADAIVVEPGLLKILKEGFTRELQDYLRNLPDRPNSTDIELTPKDPSISAGLFMSATWKMGDRNFRIESDCFAIVNRDGRESRYPFFQLGIRDLEKLFKWIETLPEGTIRNTLLEKLNHRKEDYLERQELTAKRAFVIADLICSQKTPLDEMKGLTVNGKSYELGYLDVNHINHENEGEVWLFKAINALRSESKKGPDNLMGVENVAKFLVSFACEGRVAHHQPLREIIREAPDFEFVGWSLSAAKI